GVRRGKAPTAEQIVAANGIEVEIRGVSTSARVGLHVEHVADAGPVGCDIICVDVSDSTRHLAATGDPAPRPLESAAEDDDVLRWCIDSAAVVVAPRLNPDAVIVRIERAVLDYNVVAGFGIAPVCIGVAGAAGGDTVDGHVATQRRMQLPEL